MNMTNINHELIGKYPEVEGLRAELDEIILRYEQWAAEPHEDMQKVSTMSPTELQEFVVQVMLDPARYRGVIDAGVIELCGAHFYGIDPSLYETTHEIIDQINAFEDELRVR